MWQCSPAPTPEQLGKYVTLSHSVDANLIIMTTSRSVTRILHLANKTPIEWYSKKQATVEKATYGSEFVAARICVEQIIDVRNTLRYLGVPIRDESFMFGDNKSIVDSSMQLNAKLHKRHTMLSFHRVREAIAAGIVTFLSKSEVDNPANIFRKHWGYSQMKERLKVLLFWEGDTADIQEGEATFRAKGDCQGSSARSCRIAVVFPNFHRNQPDRATTSTSDGIGGTCW
jgi:hypothetical protein